MKQTTRTFIITLIIYIFVFIGVSFAETAKPALPNLIKSKLTEKGAELIVKRVELYNINLKLIPLRYGGEEDKSVFQKDFLDAIDNIIEGIQEIIDLLDYESQLILTIPHLKDEYKSVFSNLRIEKIDTAKKLIKIKLQYMNYIYLQPEYKSVLLTAGDPIKSIHSSLDLFDEIIIELQKIPKKNNKPLQRTANSPR